ncbi:hypothetical protein QCA50_021129 [Cerrena zonata]|uniref:Aminoglycoside phosphotransferase n=1 Tax=Cerrena zonata TaxID=2478898 RepID=A0AAW0FB86_9APHY
MSKLQKLGVNAPAVILADLDNGIIWMEYLGTELPNGDDGQPLLIDFGLSSYSGMPEDKAVDLKSN